MFLIVSPPQKKKKKIFNNNSLKIFNFYKNNFLFEIKNKINKIYVFL